MRRALARSSLSALLALLPLTPELLAGSERSQPPLKLEIDARQILAKVQHAHLVVPVRPGPLALAYPKWLPGEHRANGPITQLVNLRMEAAGRPLPWRRDPRDPFIFRVDIPAGADSLDIRFDYLSPSEAFGNGFGKAPNMTPHLQWVLFNHLLLYPADAAAGTLRIQAELKLPPGWTADSALPLQARGDGALSLPVVTLDRLVDSPVLAGQFLRSLPLPTRRMEARLSVAADAEADLQPEASVTDSLGRLIDETLHLFGQSDERPQRYAWLVSLSDLLSHDGLEHRNSSDVRAAPGLLRDPHQRFQLSVLSHELFHAWNGKAMRPEGLTSRNYQQPARDDLLWFYEGLTRYYGDVVLPVRSGLITRAQANDYLAYVGAQISQERPGRAWRSLLDTAVAIPAYGDAPLEGTSIRRGADYYNEMLLVWLEADLLIRERSGGARSLDDVCRRFFTTQPGATATRTYSRKDVVDALQAVQDLDWDRFLRTRIDDIQPRPPLGGLAASGWTLSYDNQPNPFIDDVEAANGSYDFMTSLGIRTDREGQVQDVLPGSPAAASQIAGGMQITQVDRMPWSVQAVRRSLLASQVQATPVELRVQYGDVVRTLQVPWKGGLRIPHLRRDGSHPDLLSRVLAPQAGATSAAARPDRPLSGLDNAGTSP